MAVLLLGGCGSANRTTPTLTPSQPATTTSSTARTTTSIPSSNGSATAVLPARFTVDADGSMSPPLISGPLDTTIQLTVTSKAMHPVTLTVASRSLAIAPGGHTSARLQGLKAGRYTIRVDGTPRAALVVGVQPGP